MIKRSHHPSYSRQRRRDPEGRCCSVTSDSISRGRELGYALLHAYGVMCDNPVSWPLAPPVMARRDRPARRQLALQQALDSACDGALVSMLHLDGYKIAYTTALASTPARDVGIGQDPDRSRRRTVPPTYETHRSPWPNEAASTQQTPGVSNVLTTLACFRSISVVV